MTTKLTIADFQKMINQALVNITARAEEFSKLDAVIGDGDHGEAIVTALEAIVKASKKDAADFKTLFGDMGFAVMLETSGSTSTLLGGLMLGLSDGVPESVCELTAPQVKVMMRSGLEGVCKNTKAMPGDKTMMDSLVPAVEAIEACDSQDIKVIFETGSQAAEAGALNTIGMKANFGRARNYGDKSIGHADSGASSWACMITSFAQAL